MATGWAKEGAVQEQIDATVKDAIDRAKSQLPTGPSLMHCADCGKEIPEARRVADSRGATLCQLPGNRGQGQRARCRIQPARQQGQPAALAGADPPVAHVIRRATRGRIQLAHAIHVVGLVISGKGLVHFHQPLELRRHL